MMTSTDCTAISTDCVAPAGPVLRRRLYGRPWRQVFGQRRALLSLSLLVATQASVLTACGGATAREDGTNLRGSIAFEPCHLAAPGLSERLAAECGSLQVPEDPTRPDGRAIDLRIAVLPAVSRRPESDPLFFLAGGPGQAATEAYPALAAAFQRINQYRDIVLVDQRGTGGSHKLMCGTATPDATRTATPDATATPGGSTASSGTAEINHVLEDGVDVQEIQSQARECLDRLDADPRQYTTTIAMADLDRVRAALGYERINLYGVSYGTRAALEYARRYPEQVRSMVLDGVLAPEVALGATAARDAGRAMDLILSRCAEDEACGAAFPNVRADFAALQAELKRAPMAVAFTDPTTGTPMSTTLDWPKAATAFRFLSYSPETAALIPLLVDTTYRLRNPVPLAAQFNRITESLSDEISDGMHHSVVCAEDEPFFDAAEIARDNRGAYLGDQVTEALAAACAVWPRGKVPADFKAAVESEIPTLLLSGEADPVTPPEYADRVARTLPAGRHITVPAFGHGVATRGCVRRMINAFVETADAAGLTVDCVGDIEAVPFFRSFNGPGG